MALVVLYNPKDGRSVTVDTAAQDVSTYLSQGWVFTIPQPAEAPFDDAVRDLVVDPTSLTAQGLSATLASQVAPLRPASKGLAPGAGSGVTVTYTAANDLATTIVGTAAEWSMRPGGGFVRYLEANQVLLGSVFPSSQHFGSDIRGRGRDNAGAFEFLMTAETAELQVVNRSGSSYWVWVNDKPLTAAPVEVAIDGSLHLLRLTNASPGPANPKRIRVMLYGHEWATVLKTELGDGRQIVPLPVRRNLVAFEGDSITDGAVTSALSSWYRRFAVRVFPGADLRVTARGGTGYTVGDTTLLQRVDQLAASSPDVVIVAAGRNDGPSSLAATKAAAQAYFAALRERIPTAEIVCFGPWMNSSEYAGALPLETAIFEGARLGDPFVTTISTVTGDVPFVPATAATYFGPDPIHPNQDGSDHLGDWAAEHYAATRATGLLVG